MSKRNNVQNVCVLSLGSCCAEAATTTGSRDNGGQVCSRGIKRTAFCGNPPPSSPLSSQPEINAMNGRKFLCSQLSNFLCRLSEILMKLNFSHTFCCPPPPPHRLSHYLNLSEWWSLLCWQWSHQEGDRRGQKNETRKLLNLPKANTLIVANKC